LPEHFKKQREYQRHADFSSATREDGLITVLPLEQSSVQELKRMGRFQFYHQRSSVQGLKKKIQFRKRRGWADFNSARGAMFSAGTAEDGQFSVLLEEQSSVQELQTTGSFQFC
jgi:hypothetical protein